MDKILQFFKSDRRLKNFSYYFLASLISAFTSFLTNPFFALYLEHKDYAITGFYASFQILFVPFIGLSLSSFYARNYFKMDNIERIRVRNILIVSMLFISFFLTMIALVGLYTFFQIKKISLPFWPYALLSVMQTFFSIFYSFLMLQYRLEKNAKTFFNVNVSHTILGIIAAVIFVIVFKMGALGKMLSAATVAFLFCVFSIKKLLTRWEFDLKILRKAFLFSWPISLAAALNYFFGGIDRAFLEGFKNTTELGLYNIALQITGYFTLFTKSINSTFEPNIYEAIAKRNTKKTFILAGQIALINSIPIMIFIAFAPFWIKILTFNRFTASAGYAQILAIKQITDGFYFIVSSMLIGYGFSKFILINKIVGTVVSYFMFWYLISNFQYYGAAWGQVFALFITSFYALIFLAYKEGFFKKLLWKKK